MFLVNKRSSKSKHETMLKQQIKSLSHENKALREELDLYRSVFADARNYVENYQAEIAKVRELKKSYEELIKEVGQIRSDYSTRMKSLFN